MPASNEIATSLTLPDLPPVVELDAAVLGRTTRDDIQRMASGAQLATVVRGLFSPAMISRVTEAIDASQLPVTRPPVLRGIVYGRPLVAAAETLDTYLDDATCFRRSALLGGIEETIGAALTQLSVVPARVPTHDGRAYAWCTVRRLVDGDRIPLHHENETLDRPVMRWLRPSLDDRSLLSFVVSIATATRGGELRVYPGPYENLGDHFIPRAGGDDGARAALQVGSRTLDLALGDLVVFDGGRYYHEVVRVEGAPRVTLGGFLAARRDGTEVSFWG